MRAYYNTQIDSNQETMAVLLSGERGKFVYPIDKLKSLGFYFSELSNSGKKTMFFNNFSNENLIIGMVLIRNNNGIIEKFTIEKIGLFLNNEFIS